MKKEKKQKKIKFWRIMFPYIKEYRTKIAISTVCSILVGICVACQPLIIKFIVDSGISNNALGVSEKMTYVGKLCGLYLFLGATRIVIWRIGLKQILSSLEGSIFNLRAHFFKHVQHLCMKFYDNISTGELFNCIMGSPIINIKTYMQQLFQIVPYQAISLIISLGALMSFDWVLTLILFTTSLTMAIVHFVSRRKIRAVASDYIRTESETSKYLNNTLSGINAVKLYSIEDNTFKSFSDFLQELSKKGISTTLSQSLEGLKPELIQYIGTSIVYIVGAYSCIKRGMSVGVLYAFLSSMGSILGILISWLNIGLQQTSAESGLEKIVNILNQNTSTPEKKSLEQRDILIEKKKAISSNRPYIAFENVCFGYDNRKIFHNLNCEIKYGESVALVGTSGSGKSTFTKLLMRLYDVDDGRILVCDNDIKDYNIHNLRVTFGVVPQNPFIFFGSVWDNIKIARPDASNKDIINAMEIAHVHEFVNEMTNGWNTVVGEGGIKLSGGQIQRIAIARAVLGNPDILIFDEATSALDNVSEKHIQESMEELMKTHTILIVAHRLSTIKNVDRILVFKNGEIIEEGTYSELENKGGAFSELLNG